MANEKKSDKSSGKSLAGDKGSSKAGLNPFQEVIEKEVAKRLAASERSD